MRRLGQILLLMGSTMVLLCSTLLAQHRMPGGVPSKVMAQFPTLTPQEITPTVLTPTGTVSSTPTSTETSTHTPTATNTTTGTPTNTPTRTPAPSHTPTSTRTPTRTNTPVTPPPAGTTHTPQPTKEAQPPSSPKCQSSVQGRVFNAAGHLVAGATVTIQGEGWSSGIMTNDEGHYGFGGLCAGTAVLQAFLPNGRTSPPVSVSLTGQNSIQLDLRPDMGTTSVPTTSAQQTTVPTARPTSTQAEMPETGFSGWLLAGGAGLAALLLLSAGARRRLRGGDESAGQE